LPCPFKTLPVSRYDGLAVALDVSGTTVEVLTIAAKSEAESWLAQFGSPE
jgi:hypothetical protein